MNKNLHLKKVSKFQGIVNSFELLYSAHEFHTNFVCSKTTISPPTMICSVISSDHRLLYVPYTMLLQNQNTPTKKSSYHSLVNMSYCPS